MAEITITIPNVDNIQTKIDLGSTTNKQLIDTLIQEGFLKKQEEFEYSDYYLIGKDRCPIYGVDTLSNLGFKDGDDIIILRRPIG